MSVKQQVVEVQPREERGTNACRRLRTQGWVPGVVYGMGIEPFAVSVKPRVIEDIIRLDTGRNTLFTLALADRPDQKRAAMIKELVREPVRQTLEHVDFMRVDLGKKVQVRVPLSVTGESVGVKEGGILELVLRDVGVECLPGEIPESFVLDVGPLPIGGALHVKDVTAGAGVEVLDDPEQTVLHVVAPRVEEEPTDEAAEGEAAEGEAAAEPAEGASEGGSESSES